MLVWSLAACFDVQQEAHLRRAWEMRDHEHDLFAARDAITRRDLASATAAGERIAEKDPIPGLPTGATAILERLRQDGEVLARATTLVDAADALTATTRDCAACHTLMQTPVPDLEKAATRPTDLVWIAVAFESEPVWVKGVAALGGSAVEGETWDQRRAQLSQALLPR